MARKTIGYIALEWTCPTCGSVNEGKARVCHGCGAQMPPDVAFHLPGQQVLDTSEEGAEQAKAGPDIHCPFCGTRNSASAEVCSQCGGPLVGGDQRESGKVLGALDTSKAPDIACPSCGETNPATAKVCVNCGSPLVRPKAESAEEPEAEPAPERPSGIRRLLPILVIIALVICAVALFSGAFAPQTSETLEGEVIDVSWVTSVSIEAYAPIQREAWHDEIPEDGEPIECWSKIRHEVDEPVANSVEVCGTPYVIDAGTGQGQVVQDCVYQVSDAWCSYQTWVWVPGESVRLQGRDMVPRYATGQLASDQRAVGQSADMKVVLRSGDRTFGYSTTDLDRFQQFEVGSQWEFEVNSLGGVRPVRRID